MNEHDIFEIKKYEFSHASLPKINEHHYVSGLWPLVYILSDENSKEVYVGETTDAFSRMSTHLKNNTKSKLTAVRLIMSDKFNKSATLDIESNLIKYIAGDGQYKLLNGNIGLANHTYYQKSEVYWDIFKAIWNGLQKEKITVHDLDTINNSDLFKYSPYKTLSTEQKDGLMNIIKSLLSKNTNTVLVEGGAGTGKTILAVFLFKLLNSDVDDFNFKEFGDDEKEFIELVRNLRAMYPNPKMALVVPMSSFRSTLQKVFKNIKGLRASMVIGPAEVVRQDFDIIIVDESHRLRRRVNLGAYFGAFDKASEKIGIDIHTSSELQWILKQSEKSVLFYDNNQTIKPSDVSTVDFEKLKSDKRTIVQNLKSQFRVKGGVDYVTYINNLLRCNFRKQDSIFTSKDYEFTLFESLGEMIERIKEKDNEFGLCRLVAGYSWEWVSRNQNEYDIVIDSVKLNWNSVSDDWVNSQNALNEVGCIHTTQGYDLNYTGVIFGNEISYDKEKGEIVIKKENYFDRNGRQGISDPDELKEFIINIYKTILLRGIRGTYVYVCDKNLRDYLREHMNTVGIPTNTEKVVAVDSPYAGRMVSVPMFESVGCGELLYADSTIQEIISVREDYISRGSKYFILRASGDSMNKAGIYNGDLVLCLKNYNPPERSNVVALIGEDATIKEYHRENGNVILKPNSDNPSHRPLKYKNNEEIKIQGVVVSVLKEGDYDDIVS